MGRSTCGSLEGSPKGSLKGSNGRIIGHSKGLGFFVRALV